MNPFRLRNVSLLAAAFAALFLPALSMAQKPKTTTPATAARSAQHPSHEQQLLTDFGNLARFREANRKLGPPAPGENRVVFMGDSITQGWDLAKSFPGKPYINRGISGQTSTQMLLRFRQDVIDLKPRVVVILAGTNDVAENTGPMPLSQTEGDIVSMAQLARANGIRVVLCSVLPSVRFPWHPQVPNVAPKIAEVNRWLQELRRPPRLRLRGLLFQNERCRRRPAQKSQPRRRPPLARRLRHHVPPRPGRNRKGPQVAQAFMACGSWFVLGFAFRCLVRRSHLRPLRPAALGLHWGFVAQAFMACGSWVCFGVCFSLFGSPLAPQALAACGSWVCIGVS